MSSKKQTTPSQPKPKESASTQPKKTEAPAKTESKPATTAAPAPAKTESKPATTAAPAKVESAPKPATTAAPAKTESASKTTAAKTTPPQAAAKGTQQQGAAKGEKKGTTQHGAKKQGTAKGTAKKTTGTAKKSSFPTSTSNSFLKAGKVVILLHGRYAGHKAVIIKAVKADKKRHFPGILVAGIERYPLKVTRKMGVRRIFHRSQVKPFVKIVNVAHVMPTRYSMDADLKAVVTLARHYGDSTRRGQAKTTVRKLFQERYRSGKNRWFFSPLRF